MTLTNAFECAARWPITCLVMLSICELGESILRLVNSRSTFGAFELPPHCLQLLTPFYHTGAGAVLAHFDLGGAAPLTDLAGTLGLGIIT